jgi:hypothetical protein
VPMPQNKGIVGTYNRGKLAKVARISRQESTCTRVETFEGEGTQRRDRLNPRLLFDTRMDFEAARCKEGPIPHGASDCSTGSVLSTPKVLIVYHIVSSGTTD